MRVENRGNAEWTLTVSTRELQRIEDALDCKTRSGDGAYYRDQGDMRDVLRTARLTKHEIQVVQPQSP